MTDEESVDPAGRAEVVEPDASREIPAPPMTGDDAVDDALRRLHESASTGDLDAQAEAGETAHRALQDRLADLGGD